MPTPAGWLAAIYPEAQAGLEVAVPDTQVEMGIARANWNWQVVRQCIEARYSSGTTSHHVGPNPDMTRLYVNNMGSSTLLEIDARTGKPTRTLPAAVPYNLYFTTDGTKAIAAEPNNRLDFYDPASWQRLTSLPLPCNGVDHLDMAADGRSLLVSCEFDGQVIRVDTARMVATGAVRVGGLPVDVKLSPDGAVFYVANQGRHGVSVVDATNGQWIATISTGTAPHSLAFFPQPGKSSIGRNGVYR